MLSRKPINVMSIDSLLDTMTNVVGILIILLVVTQLNVGDAVRRIKAARRSESIPEEVLLQTREEYNSVTLLQEEVKKQWNEHKGKKLEMEAKEKQLCRLLGELEQSGTACDKLPTEQELKIEVAKLKGRLKIIEEEIKKAERALRSNESELAEAIATQPKPSELCVPTLSPAPENLRPIYFVCRHDKICPLDAEVISERLLSAVRKATGKRGKNITINSRDASKIANYFDKHDVGDEYFRLKVRDLHVCLLLTTEHRSPPKGETPDQLTNRQSIYTKTINEADPSKQFVKFYVWSDSFDAYLAAKELAERKGLRGNWAPFGENETLSEILGGGGPAHRKETVMW